MKLPSFLLPSQPAYDIKKHVEHVRKLYDKYPYRTYEEGRAALPGILGQICDDRFPQQIAKELGEAVYTVLRQANVFFLSPPEDEDPDYLKRLQAVLSSPQWTKEAIASAARLFRDLYRRLPQSVFEDQAGTMRVPLYELIENVPDLIMHIAAYSQAKHDDIYIFDYLNKQLNWNAIRASGYSVDTYEGKPLTFAFEAKMPTPQLIQAYLGGTPFADLLMLQVPFVIPRKVWASHGIILAPPNHGKTQLLGSLISGFLSSPEQPGLFVLDPHGDLYATLSTRVHQSRLVLLDPDTDPPPLNFLDFGHSTEAQTLQTFSYLMSSLSGGLSDKQGAIVPYLLKLLRKIPDASLETLRLIVDEKVKGAEKSRFWPAISTLPEVDQGFFHNQFYSARMQETKDAIGWKLYSALSSDAFRQMFSAKENSFDADAAMRDRKVVLVKGGRSSLGDDGMSVFLQFIVAQFFSAALRREKLEPQARHLCLIFADEANHVFNSQTANILTECRKYGLGFVAATQVVQQIPDDVKAAIYGATAIKVCGPVSHTDATILSREMHTTTDFIRSMRAVERQGAQWAFYVQNVTPHAIRVTVPYGVLESLPKQNAAERRRPQVNPEPIIPQTEKPASGSEAGTPKPTPEPKTRKHNPDDFPEDW